MNGKHVIKAILATVGIAVAAAAVSNLRAAMNRSKQNHTMADIRAIATAWEARAAGPLPANDGWGTPFELRMSADHLYIRSYGSDRKRDAVTRLGATTDYAADLIYEDSSFTAYPEGI